MEPDTLYLLESEKLEGCTTYLGEWDMKANAGVFNKLYDGVYDLEKLDGNDPYEVYLSGPESLVRVENPNAGTDRELVIFRDSFASSIVPLLLEDYAAVTLVDIRYIQADMLSRFGYKISREDVVAGLYDVTAPCKFEILSVMPTIIADSTHTPIAIEAVCDSLLDFQDITGKNIRLCLPDGELISQYVSALQSRGYSIEKISALEIKELSADRGEIKAPLSLCKTEKATAKDALASLDNQSALLISGSSNFTRKIRYEILNILGF
jgi:folylpolyglutamate synthase/dihydropteroate synthase